MNPIKLAVLLAAITAISGCTTIKGWFVDEDAKAQAKQAEAPELVVPKKFINPKKSDEFTLPPGLAKAAHENAITSPTSVLVFLEKSWVNQDDPHPAKIMIEKPDLVDDLALFIEKGIQSYAQQYGIKSTKLSAQQYRMVLPIEVETGFWFWQKNIEAEKFEFLLNVKMQAHGRSGEISIDPLHYEKLKDELASPLPAPLRKETLAIQSLNDFMLELDYLYRVNIKREQSELDVTLALVKDVAGNTVISSQQDIVYVFKELDDILEQLGFDIEDDNDELYIYTVTYTKGRQSLWDALFNSDFANKIDLESGEYEVSLTTSVEGVHIKIRDKQGKAITDAQMRQVYELMMALVEDEELEI